MYSCVNEMILGWANGMSKGHLQIVHGCVQKSFTFIRASVTMGWLHVVQYIHDMLSEPTEVIDVLIVEPRELSRCVFCGRCTWAF